ncbi:hypothetical protein Nepgr_017616 [Nepenthes gracilis]|uniref:Uncharacterized protein n=1 Tax=Nepenthes gracilis TaxID=150966 RepID=A0AAD3SRS3_NEPGR|nr:hypothetical protein Nepgr_017616 [Nepenthes gracilis]
MKPIVTFINNINNMLVVIVMAIKDLFNEILMIHRLAYGDKFTGMNFTKLHIIRNYLGILDGLLDLFLDQLDMSTRGLGIGIDKSTPSDMGGQRNERDER